MAMKLRACKRCGGDLVPDRWDPYGRTLTCLQCGADVAIDAVGPRNGLDVASLVRGDVLERVAEIAAGRAG